MHRSVVFVDEVGVVGGNHLYAKLLGKFEYALVHQRLVAVHIVNLVVSLGRQAFNLCFVEHNLQVVVFAEHAAVPLGGFARSFVVAGHEVAGNFSRQARRTAYQVFVVLLKYLMGHAGLIIETVYEAFRADLHEVLVAVVVFGQKYEVVVVLVLVVFEAVVVVPGHIHFTTHQRLHQRLAVRAEVGLVPGPLEELLDTVHVAMVGDGNGGHPELAGPGEQSFYVGQTIQYRVLCVNVQMNK